MHKQEYFVSTIEIVSAIELHKREYFISATELLEHADPKKNYFLT